MTAPAASAPAQPIDDEALDRLFRTARTQNGWLPHPVADETLKRLYDLCKMAPTSANCQPMRVIFVKSAEAKAKLKPALAGLNVDKTMAAPVTAIIAYDLAFYDALPRLFPHTDARSWFVGNDELIRATAFRNGSLQGAYLIMAARALGLDCGPMSGFDAAKVEAAFFTNPNWRANFLCNLGYGDTDKLFPRSPRPAFEEFCSIT